MAVKTTGISPDLIIHPGETIADVLADREITQVELAALTGVTPAYINQVINGKRNISVKFAVALEYALGIKKSFWINLQAHYDAEKAEFEKEHTITEGEIDAFRRIKDIVKYLRNIGKMKSGEKIEDAVISARVVLQVSNLTVLKDLATTGSFRLPADVGIDSFVLGAWLRICQLRGKKQNITSRFEKGKIRDLIIGIKNIMCSSNLDFRDELKELMAKHGIDFSLVRNFKGAPVQGYITQKSDGSYQMVLTIRRAYADIFWFSLFHELGHIYYGHVGTSVKFIDYDRTSNKEAEADKFAADALINAELYDEFLKRHDFALKAIREFASSQGVMPYIVIGRLQKQGKLPYTLYSHEKLRYKWVV